MILKLIANEPALLMGLLRAIVVLGVSFGLRLSADQTAAIFAVFYALVEVSTSLVTRMAVTPNGKVPQDVTRTP